MSEAAAPVEMPGHSRRLLPLPRTPALLLLGLAGLALTVLLTAFGVRVSGFDPSAQAPAQRLLPPGTGGHLLGTDQLGRDVFSRVAAGFRWSVSVGVLATCIAGLAGTAGGVLAGWNEGWPRSVLTRLMDTAIAFPYLVLATAVIAVSGHGFGALVLILGLGAWVAFARVVYAETQSIKRREYVLAARLLGIPVPRVLLTYVLRGLRPTLLVVAAFVFADLLVAEASLSFLGVGAPLGSASWGNMLAGAREYVFTAPWLLYAPAGAVVLVVMTANLVGDGLSRRWGTGRAGD
jgi:peptide/nickel transport system permease protein